MDQSTAQQSMVTLKLPTGFKQSTYQNDPGIWIVRIDGLNGWYAEYSLPSQQAWAQAQINKIVAQP